MIRSPRVLLPAVAVLVMAAAIVVAVRSGDDDFPIAAGIPTTATTAPVAAATTATSAPSATSVTSAPTVAGATATTRGATATTGATTGPTTTRPATTTGGAVALGTWGGKGIQLTVTATGGTVDYDCAAGVISTPLTLGPAGNFDATGAHRNSTGGPIVPGGPAPKALAARYTGTVTGSQMRLTVALETGTTLGPFTLGLGQAATLDRCG